MQGMRKLNERVCPDFLVLRVASRESHKHKTQCNFLRDEVPCCFRECLQDQWGRFSSVQFAGPAHNSLSSGELDGSKLTGEEI